MFRNDFLILYGVMHYRTIRLEWEELVSISQPPLYDLLHGIYAVRMNVMLKYDTVFMLLHSVYHIFENLVAAGDPPASSLSTFQSK